jgi:hypothetical protein
MKYTRPQSVTMEMDDTGEVQLVTVDGKEFIPKQKTYREMINDINRKLTCMKSFNRKLTCMKSSIEILVYIYNRLNKKIRDLEHEQNERH